MRIRLDDARFEPFRWSERIELAEGELAPRGEVEVGPVECAGTLSFSPPDFLLRAHLSYAQEVSCNRCLKPLRLEVEDELDLVVNERRGPRGSEHEERGLEASDLGWLEVVGDHLDTRPLVVEQVLLNVPMKPLCRESCQGLCPACGKDLNEGPCDCPRRAVDPRWSALEALQGSGEAAKREN